MGNISAESVENFPVRFLAILAMLVQTPSGASATRENALLAVAGAGGLLLLPVDFSVKNAPVQAAPPKDYTLFVGTDKTAIQSTDQPVWRHGRKSGQSPAQVRDTIIQRPVTNPEQKTTRYIPVTTILFLRLSWGAAAFLLYQGSPTPSSAARCAVEERRRPRGLRLPAL